MVGPIQFTFMYCGPRGSPTAQSSSARMAYVQGDAPSPPISRGQCGVSQPRAASRGQNVRENATCASRPGPSLATSLQSDGDAVAQKSLMARRNARSASDQPKFNAAPSENGVTKPTM